MSEALRSGLDLVAEMRRPLMRSFVEKVSSEVPLVTSIDLLEIEGARVSGAPDIHNLLLVRTVLPNDVAEEFTRTCLREVTSDDKAREDLIGQAMPIRTISDSDFWETVGRLSGGALRTTVINLWIKPLS